MRANKASTGCNISEKIDMTLQDPVDISEQEMSFGFQREICVVSSYYSLSRKVFGFEAFRVNGEVWRFVKRFWEQNEAMAVACSTRTARLSGS